MEYAELTQQIIQAAMRVHRALGPGLLESAYEECLAYEFYKAGLQARRQVQLPVTYERITLEIGYRIDFVINETVVLEIKSVETVLPVHRAQLLTYMRVGNWPVGLLINFNVELLKNGIRRLQRTSRNEP